MRGRRWGITETLRLVNTSRMTRVSWLWPLSLMLRITFDLLYLLILDYLKTMIVSKFGRVIAVLNTVGGSLWFTMELMIRSLSLV